MSQQGERTWKVYVVDGNIASGKSTFINMLHRRLRALGYRVTVVREPVDQWETSGILQKFYDDKKRWSYTFQTEVFTSRIMENVLMFDHHKDETDIFILERSCFTDTLFMELLEESGDVTDLEMKCYRNWSTMWDRVMPYKPTSFIYLKTSVKECMKRKNVRHRDAESSILWDYLEALERKHDQFFSDGYINIGDDKRAPVVVIDCEQDYRDDVAMETSLVNKFIRTVEL